LKVRILVLGSGGLLGSTVVPELASQGFQVTTMSKGNRSADFHSDPFNQQHLWHAVEASKCDVVLNMVALTSVEECELDPQRAIKINSQLAANFASFRINSPQASVRWVEISTDHLYTKPGPSIESDVSAVNIYAATKWLSELYLDKNLDLILRTNFVGRSKVSHRESLTDWIVKNSTGDDSHVEVLNDVYFSPVSIARLARYISTAIHSGLFGLYNVGSSGSISKADFDFAFARNLGLDTDFMRPIRLEEAKFLQAPRPKDMVMNSSRFYQALGLEAPDILEIVQEVADEYRL
jgi:dTDP-4-dehydrorhamnose reductase